MRAWNLRAKEVAYLLNPAFCGRILYNTIKVYNEESNRPLPLPLIYLILPLILHKQTRLQINSRTQLLVWLQRNPEMLIGFSERAKSMISITNEAIELLLQSSMVKLTNNAELAISQTLRPLSKTKYSNTEVKESINKGEHVAKWFVQAGKTETIFVSLGVRP